jgi:preprotein translocase subunit SecD
MRRAAGSLAVLMVIGLCVPAWGQNPTPGSTEKVRDGVYAVLRDGLNDKDLLPLNDGEALIADRHRYLKAEDQEPARFLVVRAAPDVDLDLAEAPKAVKEGDEVVRVMLKLQPKAATALERLTADRRGKQIAIVLDGEVVTIHKVREVIKGGDVQITSCTPGAAKYLLEQLQAHREAK